MYDILANSSCTWMCPQCGLPNLSDPLSNISMDSLASPNVFQPLNGSIHTPQPTNHRRNEGKRKPTTQKLSCLLVNCRSVKNKVAAVEAVIKEHKPDIIIGNESWLTPEIASSEIFPVNYIVHRKDRNNENSGGGVFQAIKRDLVHTVQTLILIAKLFGLNVNKLDQIISLFFFLDLFIDLNPVICRA